MSKSQQKKNDRILEQAEYLWEQAQLKAALAKSQLDGAVEIYKNMKHEMDAEEQGKTNEQIGLRNKDIEEFLETARQQYLERLKYIKEV
jgi:hypothetical protein